MYSILSIFPPINAISNVEKPYHLLKLLGLPPFPRLYLFRTTSYRITNRPQQYERRAGPHHPVVYFLRTFRFSRSSERCSERTKKGIKIDPKETPFSISDRQEVL